VKRPLDVINLAFVAMILALTAFVGVTGRLPNPWPLALRLLLMAVGVGVMAWLARRPKLPAAVRLATDFYPLVLVPLVFDSIGPLIPAIHPIRRDDMLIAIDRWLLGVDPTVWLSRWLSRPLSDLMFLLYCTYYFVPLVVAISLWRKSADWGREFIFVITLAFYVSYVGYFLVPALGPRSTLHAGAMDDLLASPISRTIAHTLNVLENTKNDAFPSGHTMISVMCVILAYGRTRWAFWIALFCTLGVIAATIYCRYHYVIDVIAGLVLAFAMVPIGAALYRRATAVPARQDVPAVL